MREVSWYEGDKDRTRICFSCCNRVKVSISNKSQSRNLVSFVSLKYWLIVFRRRLKWRNLRNGWSSLMSCTWTYNAVVKYLLFSNVFTSRAKENCAIFSNEFEISIDRTYYLRLVWSRKRSYLLTLSPINVNVRFVGGLFVLLDLILFVRKNCMWMQIYEWDSCRLLAVHVEF